jgi:hypothetical protein
MLGTLNLFTSDFMGSAGAQENIDPNGGSIGDPWLSAGFYDPQAGTSGHPPDRDGVGGTAADPPVNVGRPSNYPGPPPSPLLYDNVHPYTAAVESQIYALANWGPGIPTNHQGDPSFENIKANYFRTFWEDVHNHAHPYFADIDPHNAFRDPFVFLLHSNTDRVFAMWQCDPTHPERLDPNQIYGAESNMDVDVDFAGIHSVQNLTHLVESFSTGHGQFAVIRPWAAPENQGQPHDYHDLTVVAPVCYDTLPTTVRIVAAENPGNVINFNDVPQGETAMRAAVFQVFACGDVTLQVTPGEPAAPYSVAPNPGNSITILAGAHQQQIARLWFQFTGGAPGPAPNGSVTIHCVQTNQDFVFTIHGDSIAQPKVATMLVLDQSGSMGWLAGIDATTKRIDVLHQAANNFLQLVPANDAVGGSLDARTFAIGLGTAQQVSAGALNKLTSQTAGYVLLSGPLSPSIDDTFCLRKYFLQVLAGVTNTSVVTDPSGTLFPGVKARIPFQLSEADISTTAILLTDRPGATFLIETPAGDVMTPASAAGLGAQYAVGTDMSYYRFTLPLALGASPARAGTWYAVLEYTGRQADAAAARGGGVRYSFIAQAFTNLRMSARLSQNSLEPGASVTISCTLTEYGIPVARRATVQAYVEFPDNSLVTLPLPETDAGRFQASMTAVIPGVYRIRVVASGATMRGVPFTREQSLSATAILGGDNPAPTTGPSTKAADEQLCKLIECLLGPNAFGRLLTQHNIDPKAVSYCIETWCKSKLAGPSAQELAEREGTAK